MKKSKAYKTPKRKTILAKEPKSDYSKLQWSELNSLIDEFENLGLAGAVNFEEFNRIAIVHHSSAIEGSTLTLEESALLLSEGIVAKGKPMSEHEMVKDHYKALLFTLDAASKKNKITPDFLKTINSLVNKNTGQIRNTPLGICNDAKGDFRLGNVRAGESYFVNYDKVPDMVNRLCSELQQKAGTVKTRKEIYNLSFDAHFNLVSIHPWFDGNGRTSRLLMNFIQRMRHVPLSIVFTGDKSAYFKALTETRKENNPEIFRTFMCRQQVKFLKMEIEKYKKAKKGFSFLF